MFKQYILALIVCCSFSANADVGLLETVSLLEKRVELLELKLEAIDKAKKNEPEKVKSIADYTLSKEALAYRDHISIIDYSLKMGSTESFKEYLTITFTLKNNGNRDIKELALTAYFLDKTGKRIQEHFILPVSPHDKLRPLFKAGYVLELKEGSFYLDKRKAPTGWVVGNSEAEVTYIEFAD
jgi:hypothetical protein